MKYVPALAVLAVFCLVLATSLRGPEDPPTKPASAESKPKPGDYPAFDPFTQARLFKLLGKDIDKINLDEQLDMLTKMAGSHEKAMKATEKLAGKSVPPGTVEAFLQPHVDPTLRVRYSLLPVAMMKLAPLWSSETWTPEQLATGTSTATFLAAFPDAPKLGFQEGKASENHAQIAKLVRWFEKQVVKPELYAAMIITMDDGPFAGLPYAKKDLLPAKSSVVLDGQSKLELHLCKDETLPEPWVLQAVKSDKLLWSRVLSGSPRGQIAEAELVKDSRQWEGYGWKAFVQIKWTYGVEMAYLYLDPKAELSFYFLTW